MDRPIVIEIPEPGLVVLVGAAGAGKSTFAARHFDPGEVLSSDAFRETVSGDAADQAATRPAFAALHRALGRRLASGRLAVVDATNVTQAARRALLRQAARSGVPAVAIVLDLDPALVMARNRSRSWRVVPDDVVRSQLADLRETVRGGTLDEEGFGAVVRLPDPGAVDTVQLVRVRC